MALLGTKINIAFTGTGSGTVSSANIPAYTAPVFVTNPVVCNSPGPCVDLDTQNSPENLIGPWSFTLTATPDPGSVFVGWTWAAGFPQTNPPFNFAYACPSQYMCPKTSANASEVFTFENSDVSYRVTAEFALSPCNPITLQDDGPFNIFFNEPIVPITLIPIGGTAPYTFTIDPNWDACPDGLCPGATLPPGLTIGVNTGIISGTATGGSPCPYIPIMITDANQCWSVVCIRIIGSERPIPPCYELIRCVGRPNPITVTNNLAQYIGPNIVIQILDECFTVQLAQSCVGAITLNNPVITVFTDCCSCAPPTCYELVDCTLQTPAIITDTNLANYVGQTIKVCDFTSAVVFPMISPSAPFTCAPNDKGFVTQITGPTSGYYYETVSGLIKPYTNPLNFNLVVGSAICINPVSPFNVVSHNTTGAIYVIQFFDGTTPITNSITINNAMSSADIQHFINAAIITPATFITVVSFTNFTNLVVSVNIQTAVTGPLQVCVTQPAPAFPTDVIITEEFIGKCICYTVNDLGQNCNCQGMPFIGTISGTFPDCICCDPPLAPEPPPYVPTIPEIDKKTYFIRESQCDIDVNKTFANAMYDQFKTDAYGMESCCPRNMNQIWMAKELSDLSKINC